MRSRDAAERPACQWLGNPCAVVQSTGKRLLSLFGVTLSLALLREVSQQLIGNLAVISINDFYEGTFVPNRV